MNSPLAALVSLSLLAAPAAAAPRKEPPKREASALSKLLGRISSYLNSEPVRKARVAAAVAAVRGGIPTDQGEDLDQRLLDRAVSLRARLLASSGAKEARGALRPVYSALAVSQWVQALELSKDASLRAELGKLLAAWASQAAPPPPASLKAALAAPDSLDSKALVAAGWGAYCRSITPEAAAAPAGPPAAFDPETARLDEALQSLKRSWLEKKLSAPEEAQAHALAGQVYAGLAAAPLEAAALERGRSSAAGAKAPPAPAPRRRAAEALTDSGPEFSPRAIYGRASKAVVLIICGGPDGSGELGSGSILDSSGRVLTNAHVVIRDSTREPWPEVRVYLKPARMTGDPKRDVVEPRKAKVVAWDNGLDLALIQMEDPPPGLSTLSLGDPEEVVVGDRVAAIGHPEQGGLWTLTTGVVSTLVADLGGVKGKDAFQTDASINRGNSGGPLLNAYGDIIGVNTLMSRKAADGLAITAVNFAVRSDVAGSWLSRNGAAVALAKAEPAPGPAPAPAPALADARGKADPPARPASRPAPKRETVTESKPYDRDRLIEEQIKEMEDLEAELLEEIRKHR